MHATAGTTSRSRSLCTTRDRRSTMKNREIYQRDPDKIALLNNGVAAMTDARNRRRAPHPSVRTGALRLRRTVSERVGPHPGLVREQPGPDRAAGGVDQRLLWQRQVASGEDAALSVDRLQVPGGWRDCARLGAAAGRCPRSAYRGLDPGQARRWTVRGSRNPRRRRGGQRCASHCSE